MKQLITWLDIVFKTGVSLSNNFVTWISQLVNFGTKPTFTMWAIILLIVGYFDIFKMRTTTNKKIVRTR